MNEYGYPAAAKAKEKGCQKLRNSERRVFVKAKEGCRRILRNELWQEIKMEGHYVFIAADR